ncbi:MAG: toll/interleukin-1 receptor domain-containing protein [Chromatiaceae bacterium]|nr:toll/interleukin-1 receptor domain-containing protein [Gammaproteobacteria bacterium]MCP5301098.1 toll/interleukin-1 receptor domain-containing protein [Chromatiaceae bacterium]MCP5421430.1 toll/interleukin-1 receptor domain-containing protein [Chromatiaceae bacterium]
MHEHRVFLSYRRADTSGHAGRIGDDLARRFGHAVTFRDIDSIDAGADFVTALERAIGSARVCLVLIGDTWLDVASDDGTRRLDEPDDHVRREIELALAQPDLTVIPLLVEGAQMPDEDQLPPSIRRLARLQAVELSESRWDYDMSRLVAVLEQAGVSSGPAARMPRWVFPVLGLLAVALVAAVILCWRGFAGADAYTGLWYMPNGSYWTVRERDGRLWVEETHHESQQVWKRGPATLDDGEMNTALELVFDPPDFRYLYRLGLSPDGRSLIGSVRRSDRETEQSVVLSRDVQ